MRVEVLELSQDQLGARIWEFDAGAAQLRLVRMQESTRATKRHKWVGPMWHYGDERGYHSKLPRPQAIPQLVIDEAISKLRIGIYIGWTNEPNKIGEVCVRVKGDK